MARYLRTIVVDTIRISLDLLVKLYLLDRPFRKRSRKDDSRLAFFLWLSFFRANEVNTLTICTFSASARLRCSC